MPDPLFDDPFLASLYDRVCGEPTSADRRYYLALVLGASDVLDVGCGTGVLLHRARELGHTGRLVGLDPAVGMLDQARRYPDVEWVQGYLADVPFNHEFDLLIMTGHAFQVLQTDAEVHDFLAAARQALRPGKHLAFETRNPRARAWERWTPEHSRAIVGDDGEPVRVWHELLDIDGEHVTFAENYLAKSWPRSLVSRSTLRFVSAGHLDQLLCEAGFRIDERYGNWDRCPFTADSPEIITVASAA